MWPSGRFPHAFNQKNKMYLEGECSGASWSRSLHGGLCCVHVFVCCLYACVRQHCMSVNFVPLLVRMYAHMHACEKEREESLGRVMLTVGWPWGSQSYSCRWRGWLSASLPTHDGSFIIIRHTVKRCCSGPQDRVVRLWVCALVCVYRWEWETTGQRQKRKSYLLR